MTDDQVTLTRYEELIKAEALLSAIKIPHDVPTEEVRSLNALSWHYRTGTGDIALVRTREFQDLNLKLGDRLSIDGDPYVLVGIETTRPTSSTMDLIVKVG